MQQGPLSFRCDMDACAHIYRQSIECTGACQFGRLSFLLQQFLFLSLIFIPFRERKKKSNKKKIKEENIFMTVFLAGRSLHMKKECIKKIKYLFMDSLLMATHWPVNLSHAENTFWWVRLSRLCVLKRVYISFLLLLRIPFFVSIPFFPLFLANSSWCWSHRVLQQSIVDTSPLLTALSLAATMMSGFPGCSPLSRIFHPFISIHFEFYFHVYLLRMSNDLFSRVTRRGARAGLGFFVRVHPSPWTISTRRPNESKLSHSFTFSLPSFDGHDTESS